MSSDTGSRSVETPRDMDRRTSRRRLTPGIVLAASIAVMALVVAVIWMHTGLSAAERASRTLDYVSARSAIARYLWLHPGDSAARMVAARAYSLDDDLPPRLAAQQAIAHLQQIPETSSLFAEARMLEGRLTFLILHQPTRAEKLFEQSLGHAPNQFDSAYLLWKLHDMTERYFDSEKYFRQTIQLIPEEQKAIRLREWYLSQFSPFSACAELDALMGFREPTEPASEAVNYRRLTAFAEREPGSSIIAAALAQAYLRNRQRDVALEALEQVPDSDAVSDPFYIATLTEVLLELGQIDRAKSVFAKWPQPARGYRYWRIAGMIAQIADADFARAAGLYEQAVADWPGPSDWLTMHRWFRCLTLAGNQQAAESARQRSEAVEALMTLEAHQRQRDALVHIDDPERIREIADFYGALNRPWEQRQWQSVIQQLPRNQSP